MPDIVIQNLASAGGTLASTDLTGSNFSDDPIIDNYKSRDAFPDDDSSEAVPFGLQTNYSLNFNGTDQYVQGDLDLNSEGLGLDGVNYTFMTWIKINSFGTFTTTLAYENIINSRVGYDVDDVVTTAYGFTLGVYCVNTGTPAYYWALNVNGVPSDAVDIITNAPIVEDTWYFVCIVKEGANANLYVSTIDFNDTVFDLTAVGVGLTGLGDQPVDDDINFGLGLTAPGTYYWSMQMVNTSLWNVALSTVDMEEYQYLTLIPAQSEPSGLMYYYRMSPVFSETLKDLNYSRNDGFKKNFSGNPHITDSPTDWGTPNAQCLDFPGTNQHCIVYDNSNDDIPNPIEKNGTFYNFQSSFAITTWVKFDTLPSLGDEYTMGIISKWNPATGAERGFRLNVLYDAAAYSATGGTVINFEVASGGGDDSVSYIFEPTTPITINKWYWIAIVKDNAAALSGTKNYHFWLHQDNTSTPGSTNVVNDVSAAFTTIGTGLYQSAHNLYIGAEEYDNTGTPAFGHYLNGKMFNFVVYKSYRTEAELLAYRTSALNL